MGSVEPSGISVNQNILEMEYAVRGAIPQRAAELRKQGRETIPCHIGNPQALGQNPISFYRHVLSLLESPSKIAREKRLNQLRKQHPEKFTDLEDSDFISDFILDYCEKILTKMETGLGAYTESNGPLFIREAIARFIDERDRRDSVDFVGADPEQIFITNGASEGAKYVIDMLIAHKNDGIMIPTPQYPLYSASIKRTGGVQVNYYPDEDKGWTLNKDILKDSLKKAQKEGVLVKAIVVINPGNPTGAILDEQSILEILDFAEENRLAIIADEVYQENVYGAEFISFARALGSRKVPLFSLHSASKGFYGECGHRGGYLEVRNPPEIAGGRVKFTDVILKQASVSLCSNTVGQLLTYLIVSPPFADSEEYPRFIHEKELILSELLKKATTIKQSFDKMDGVECFGRIGALYLFPRLNKLPAGASDFDYCMNLLEETGLCTINGSGFGQRQGTSHLRIAFLPPCSLLEKVLPAWVEFHNRYVNS